ncbi:MAG TPA: hypothetical protein VGH04_04520 [Gemmatimonadaceae bacterium]
MPAETQLTRRRALLIGTVCVACGVGPMLGAIGVGPFHLSPGVPPWMGAAAGIAFLFASILLFADAAAGGTDADGSLPATAPRFVRFIQSAAGLGIVVVMGSMATWIAFGRGERHFSETVVLPFTAYGSGGGELPGRIEFGIAALLIWVIAIAGTIAALKKHLTRLRST